MALYYELNVREKTIVNDILDWIKLKKLYPTLEEWLYTSYSDYKKIETWWLKDNLISNLFYPVTRIIQETLQAVNICHTTIYGSGFYDSCWNDKFFSAGWASCKAGNLFLRLNHGNKILSLFSGIFINYVRENLWDD